MSALLTRRFRGKLLPSRMTERFLINRFCNLVMIEEIFFLKEELEQMLPGWKEIKVPVTIIQGVEDTLVPKENASFARRMVDPEYLQVWLEEGVNHFIPWNRPDLIRSAIVQQINGLDAVTDLSSY